MGKIASLRFLPFVLILTGSALLSQSWVFASPQALIHKLDAITRDDAKDDKEKLAAACKALKGHVRFLDKAVLVLKNAYEDAEKKNDSAQSAKTAKVLCLFALAAKTIGKIMPFGNVRIIFWGRIYSLAEGKDKPPEETLKAAAILVKAWAPMVDNLFAELMSQHAKHKANAAKPAMALDLGQLDLLAKAAETALGRTDLSQSLQSFLEEDRLFDAMTPADKRKIKEADRALKSGTAEFVGKNWGAARDHFAKARNIYTKYNLKRKMMDAAYWLAVLSEKNGEGWEIEKHLKEAIRLAKETGNRAKTREMEEYWKSLKVKENAGNITLIRSPLRHPENLDAKVETVKLTTKYGKKVPSPDPHRSRNIFFWRNIYLGEGEYLGKPADKVRLPFPGPYFWIKRGKTVLLSNNAMATGGKPVRIDVNPSKHQLMISFLGKNKAMKIRYEFYACLYRTAQVCERIIEYPPSNEVLNIRISSNTYRVGTFNRQEFVLSDDNTNGLFIDFGTQEHPKDAHEHDLKSEGSDSIFIGRGSAGKSTFLGSLVRFGDAYYEMKLNRAATEASFRKYKGPTGKMKLVFHGNRKAKVRHFILQQKVDEKRIFFVNLGNTKEPLEVPTGVYYLKYGKIAGQGLTLDVFRGSFPAVKVTTGETTEIEFGGPFKVHYPVEPAERGQWEIKTYQASIAGKRGELYWKHWPKVFAPAYQVRDKNGKLVAGGRMRCFEAVDPLSPSEMSPEQLYMYPIHIMFKPKKTHTPPYKVSVFIKHPLLGTIRDSEYK